MVRTRVRVARRIESEVGSGVCRTTGNICQNATRGHVATSCEARPSSPNSSGSQRRRSDCRRGERAMARKSPRGAWRSTTKPLAMNPCPASGSAEPREWSARWGDSRRRLWQQRWTRSSTLPAPVVALVRAGELEERRCQTGERASWVGIRELVFSARGKLQDTRPASKCDEGGSPSCRLAIQGDCSRKIQRLRPIQPEPQRSSLIADVTLSVTQETNRGSCVDAGGGEVLLCRSVRG